jgi:hypothetical protein
MGRVLMAVTALLAILAPAHALTFDFSFTGADGTVTGQVVGLNDNTDNQQPSALYIDSYPSALGAICTTPCNTTASPWSVITDEFSVSAGAITSASYNAFDTTNGAALDFAYDPALDSDYGDLARAPANETGNNLSFTTPIPSSVALFATGLGALSLFGWRRKRKNAAALSAG